MRSWLRRCVVWPANLQHLLDDRVVNLRIRGDGAVAGVGLKQLRMLAQVDVCPIG
jgi:hypothetical protein